MGTKEVNYQVVNSILDEVMTGVDKKNRNINTESSKESIYKQYPYRIHKKKQGICK